MRSKFFAELLGTFAIVFFGCGAILSGHSGAAVVFGVSVSVMIYALGHISGAHFNPSVTLAFAVARHFPLKHVAHYWLAQFAGAFLAMAVLMVLIEPSATSSASAFPHDGVWIALAWETILTFFLMFVIVAVSTDTRAVGTMAGLAIGAIVALGAYVGGPHSGAAMNPARALAPAVFEGRYEGIWIYFVGPIFGAILAAVIYAWIRCEQVEGEERSSAEGCC
ncbi:MAG: aquaporin [Bdellovibrionota bacterium]